MEKIQTENKKIDNSLVVVSAKEHGKIYQIRDGEMKAVEYVEEHPPEYSDNEGFFMRSAGGVHLGSGSAREDDDDRNIEQYIKAITSELSGAIKELQPKNLFLFEPEHLKGLVQEHVIKPDELELTLVRYGNFVEKEPNQILQMLDDFTDTEIDPADPASVEGEENAEEKRKILEVGEMRDSM
jgi:hypothetical protein